MGLSRAKIIPYNLSYQKTCSVFSTDQIGPFRHDPHQILFARTKINIIRRIGMLLNMVMSTFKKIVEKFCEKERDDRGIGVVEVILILVVLIGLVVIFRDQLTTIVNGIFTKVAEDANAI